MSDQKKFNPHEHLIKIRNSKGEADYLPVQWRLVWFREECPNGTIDTEEKLVDLDRETEAEVFIWNAEKRRSEKVVKRANGYARYKAVVNNGTGGRGTGTKVEKAAHFPDYVEKSETGAIGRALATLGYGTQFTDEEFAEGERLADAPVSRTPVATAIPTPPAPKSQEPPAALEPAFEEGREEPPATSQQIESIGKLCQYLGKAEPDTQDLSNLDAKKLIQQLTTEYRQSKQRTATVR